MLVLHDAICATEVAQQRWRKRERRAQSDRQKCIDCGMDDFSTKPISKPALLKKVMSKVFTKQVLEESLQHAAAPQMVAPRRSTRATGKERPLCIWRRRTATTRSSRR